MQMDQLPLFGGYFWLKSPLSLLPFTSSRSSHSHTLLFIAEMLARLSLLLLGALSVVAVPTTSVFNGSEPITRIDYQPPVTQPKGGEVYLAGQKISVAWKNDRVYPLENVTTTADIVLGYKTEGSSSLNLCKFLQLEIARVWESPRPRKLTSAPSSHSPHSETGRSSLRPEPLLNRRTAAQQPHHSLDIPPRPPRLDPQSLARVHHPRQSSRTCRLTQAASFVGV